MMKKRIKEYFESVETQEEYNGYFYRILEAGRVENDKKRNTQLMLYGLEFCVLIEKSSEFNNIIKSGKSYYSINWISKNGTPWILSVSGFLSLV